MEQRRMQGDEIVAVVVEQASGAAKSVADQVDAEEVADQGSPADVPEHMKTP
ncbi:unnamed protein product [Prunus armeniaca]